MQTVRMESKGIRLHPKLWERIEREARSLRLKPSDYLRRKIEDAFMFDSEVQNIVLAQSARNRLNSTWDMVGLGDRPEYEPQITLRKES